MKWKKKQKNEKINDDDGSLLYIGKNIYVQGRERDVNWNKNKTKKEKNNDDDNDSLLYLGKKPLHPRERVKSRTENANDEVKSIKKAPKHPGDRLKQMTRKLEFDINTLTEILYIIIDVPIDSLE